MIFLPLCIKIQTMQAIQNDVIKYCKMMSSNVVLLHSNNCCVVLEPAICEDLDLHVAIFDAGFLFFFSRKIKSENWIPSR